jgi:hypothetical protein
MINRGSGPVRAARFFEEIQNKGGFERERA